MGDFNLSLMNHQSHNLTGQFLDMMYSNTFFPLITRPTRITSHSATLIDNIFQNYLETNLLGSLLFTDISDHLPNFVIHYDYSKNNEDRKSFFFFGDRNMKNVSKFHDSLNIEY